MSYKKQKYMSKFHNIVLSFQVGKSLGHYGQTYALFIHLLDLMVGNLVKVVEESRISRKIHIPLNSGFVANIMKNENPQGLMNINPYPYATTITRSSIQLFFIHPNPSFTQMFPSNSLDSQTEELFLKKLGFLRKIFSP